MPTRCLDGSRGVAWVSRLRRLVSEERFDLVHAHSPVAASAARVALAAERSADRLHGAQRVGALPPGSPTGATCSRSAATATSSRSRTTSGPRCGIPRRSHGCRMPPVETLYHGIDPILDRSMGRPERRARRNSGSRADAPVVGTVANFKSHKRLDQLIRAATLVRRSVPDVRFVLVGQGPLEQELRQLADFARPRRHRRVHGVPGGRAARVFDVRRVRALLRTRGSVDRA